MKKTLIYAILILTAFVLETQISVFGVRPDITVVLVYYFGIKNGPVKGIAFGAFLGMAADSLSGGMLGPNLLSKGASGYLASLLSHGFFRWTPIFGLISLMAITALDRAVSFLSYSIFNEMPSDPLYALYSVLGQAALNSIAGLFIKPHAD